MIASFFSLIFSTSDTNCQALAEIEKKGSKQIIVVVEWSSRVEVARFTEALPFALDSSKHAAAAEYLKGKAAAIVLAQEARGLQEDPTIAREYLPLFAAKDGYTGVLLRRGLFDDTENVSSRVYASIVEALQIRFPDASPAFAKAWMTTASRIAVVTFTCRGLRLCAASIHCSRSDGTANLVEALKAALEEVTDAEKFVIGLDSNVASGAGM